METKESRNWVPQRGVAQVDCKVIHQAKAKRIKNNKGQVFSLLEEAEDIKIISEPWNKVVSQTRPLQKADENALAHFKDINLLDAMMTERNETSQLEELKGNYPWKKLKVAKRMEENQAEEDGSADNGANNGSVTRKEGTKTPHKT